MNRRGFLKNSAATTLASLTAPWSNLCLANTQAISADIRSLFEWNDPEVGRLAEDVFRECVLDKVRAPEGMLKHTWITAGGHYVGQWLWDPMFVVDLLSILPNQEQTFRDMFQNYWDFQARWNEKRPAYAHDMVSNSIGPNNSGWLTTPAFSQIPILAWGVERVYQRNHDRALLDECLGPLERFHEWYWRERDVTNAGLVAVGSYSGDPQHARYETFDYECNMDDLTLTVHPTRKGADEGAWYGDICVPGNTAYLILGEKSLMRLAEIAGDKRMAARRRARIDKSVAAMRRHMWDQDAGCFLAVRRDTLEKVPVATIGSWIGLAAGVPTAAMARRMADALQSDRWNTPLPVPTVDRKDARWRSDGSGFSPKLPAARFWRGDVWPATNYQIAAGLASYGYKKLAAELADKTVANAIRNGVSERYDSVTGKALGEPFLGMSCTIVTMMLDGLCSRYELRLKSSVHHRQALGPPVAGQKYAG
jgi:hypothetical protein